MAEDRKAGEQGAVSRRALLGKLGLAAGAIYAAPVVMKLGEARATTPTRPRPTRPSRPRPRR